MMQYLTGGADLTAIALFINRIALGAFFTGPKLPAPHSHPLDQPTPGPAGQVPSNWQTLLHE